MPKIVDPEVRREEVIDAVFRVARRDGLAQASLRNVAQEAGLAIGSVRHYFSGHAELMVFAMRAMTERLGVRLQRHADELLNADGSTDRRAVAEELLGQLLPLDDVRRDEATVWLEFATAARTDPVLQPHADTLHDGLRRLVTRFLQGVQRWGRLPESCDLVLEVERLCVLIDGLTVTAVLQPDRMPPSLIRRMLREHLDALESG